jgi:hypothetical protein
MSYSKWRLDPRIHNLSASFAPDICASLWGFAWARALLDADYPRYVSPQADLVVHVLVLQTVIVIT